MKLIFFDTEFTGLSINPRLISVGLVSEDGREFYAELSDTYQASQCDQFVQEAVLPRLQGGDVLITLPELALRLGNWMEGFDEPIKLATDSLSWDWPWINKIFCEPYTWPENLNDKPVILSQSDDFNLAVENAFAGGLRRHNALDDAKANRLGWVYMNKAVLESSDPHSIPLT